MKRFAALLFGILIAGAALATVPHEIKKDFIKKIDTGPVITDATGIMCDAPVVEKSVSPFTVSVAQNAELTADAVEIVKEKAGRYWCTQLFMASLKNDKNNSDLPDLVPLE